jgi:hypothetical protein
MGTADQLAGLGNMGQHVGAFLQIMGQNPADKPKVRQYSDLLGQMMNVLKGFAQRLEEKQAAGNGEAGAAGPDPDTVVKLQGKAMIDQAKAQNMRESHAERTAQKQVSFEMEQQRKDKQTEAEIQRKNVTFQQELAAEQARTMQELSQPQPKPPTETTE